MHPWDGLIPESDIMSFRAGFEHVNRPMNAGTKPAVIVVDMTWEFVDGRYSSGWSETGFPATAANRQLLEAARSAGIPVFFTKGFASPDELPTPIQYGRWRIPYREPDPALPPGDVIVDELAPLPTETVIHKQYKPSAFFGTPLASLLIYEGVDTVIVTGMTTSGCVRATVLDAFQYNYSVVIPYDCVADRSQISHRVNLFDMHMKYADVISLQETLEYVKQTSAKAEVART